MLEEIEAKSLKIHNSKIKEYFEEVISTYKHKNYRSTLVMLYTVSICDLIYKLQDLAEIHNSEKAQKILSDLKNEKDTNPVSPEWENQLIEKAFVEAKIIETDMYTHLTNLKKYRNLSAHPVINDTDILYKPKKAETAAMILNVLDGLLTKHPLFMKEVFVPFVVEIARIKHEFSSKEELEKYLKSKYFKHFTVDVTKYIFKNLWKFSFNKDGENESRNRMQNIKVLGILYENYSSILSRYIEETSDYFSKIIDDEKIKGKFIEFLQSYPEIFDFLEDYLKQTLRKFIDITPSYLPKSLFIAESFTKHIECLIQRFHQDDYGNYYKPKYLSSKIKQSEFTYLKQYAQSEEENKKFKELLICHYAYSTDFNTADVLFDRCILEYLEDYDLSELKDIISKHKDNPQCRDRRKAESDLEIIENRIKELEGDPVETK